MLLLVSEPDRSQAPSAPASGSAEPPNPAAPTHPSHQPRRRLSVSRLLWWFALLGFILGFSGTLWGLNRAFGVVGGESIEPSQKARLLAEGISEAMNCAAFGVATFVVGVVAALVAARFERPN